MSVLEVVLLLAGIAVAIVSFVLPAAKEQVPQETKKLAKDEIRTLVEREMEDIRQHVDDVVDEAVEYAMEKTERSLERLTNEKIMAVNEYSDTVLAEIHRNHEETMFLYDMLNNKHTNLKNTVSEVNRTVQEVTETKREAEAVVSSFQKMKPAGVEADNTAKSAAAEIAPIGTVVPWSEPEETDSPVKNTPAPAVSVMNFMTSGQDKSSANSNEKILQLHRQGKSKVAIAQELGLGVGEVKLVIDLYKDT